MRASRSQFLVFGRRFCALVVDFRGTVISPLGVDFRALGVTFRHLEVDWTFASQFWASGSYLGPKELTFGLWESILGL